MKQGNQDINKIRYYNFQKNKVAKSTIYIVAAIIAFCFIGFMIVTIDLF
jgi:hypothetical protein